MSKQSEKAETAREVRDFILDVVLYSDRKQVGLMELDAKVSDHFNIERRFPPEEEA